MMTLLDIALGTWALIGVAAVAAALYDRFFKTLQGEDGPIRVKGGSVTATADYDWVFDGNANHFKLKNDNPAHKFWSVTLTLDGVPEGPMFGKFVEVDMVDTGGDASNTAKVVFSANGGIRVSQPGPLQANGQTLTHASAKAYMAEVRLKGGVHNKTFTFTAAESKTLEITLQPQK